MSVGERDQLGNQHILAQPGIACTIKTLCFALFYRCGVHKCRRPTTSDLEGTWAQSGMAHANTDTRTACTNVLQYLN